MKILPSESIRTDHPRVLSPASPPASGAPRERPTGPSFGQVMERLGHRLDEGERAVERAARSPNASLDPGALLTLQAQVYRYVEAVDLATKLVDRATSAVKTTLQGQ